MNMHSFPKKVLLKVVKKEMRGCYCILVGGWWNLKYPPFCESNALVKATVGVVSTGTMSYFALYKYPPFLRVTVGLLPLNFGTLLLLLQRAEGSPCGGREIPCLDELVCTVGLGGSTKCGVRAVHAQCVYWGDFVDLPTYLPVKSMCFQAVKGMQGGEFSSSA